MKNYIRLILVLGIGLVACEKEVIEPSQHETNSGQKEVPERDQNFGSEQIDFSSCFEDDRIPITTERGEKGRHIITITNQQSGQVVYVECYGYGGTCAEEVDVVGIAFNPILDVIETENNVAITDVFSAKQNELNPIFGSQNVVDVINGNLTVKSLGSCLQNNGKTLTFIQFYNVFNHVTDSYPVEIL